MMRSTRLSKPKLKSIDLSSAYVPPRIDSFDRTMTNLTQRPDSFELLRSKLSTIVSPKRRITAKPGNIHMQAVRSNMKKLFRTGNGPLCGSSKGAGTRNDKTLDVSTLIKGLTVEGPVTRRSGRLLDKLT